ncbi:MAG: alpha/beta fold hydrolase [bacterium]
MEINTPDKPKALILHGWDDDPTVGWLGWLGYELQARDWQVVSPNFVTHQGRPDMQTWMEQLEEAAGQLNSNSIVIAHSLGCWLALRMLENFEATKSIAAGYLVAGFYDAPRPEASKFFSPEPNWVQLKEVCPSWNCILSQDDLIVTPDRTERLALKLGADVVRLEEYGHFLGSRGMARFPQLLDLILSQTK